MTQDALVDDRPQQQRVDHGDERVENGGEQEQRRATACTAWRSELIRRTVPGFSFCWVTAGSCLKDRIMVMLGRPYMTRETSWGRQLFPCRAGMLSASSELQGPSGRGPGGLGSTSPGRCHLGRGLSASPWSCCCGSRHHVRATSRRSRSGSGGRIRRTSRSRRPVTDALAGVIPLAEERRQLAAIHPGHPRAFLEGLGHMYLPFAAVTIELHIPLAMIRHDRRIGHPHGSK